MIMKKKADKNKTLIALIIQSESSGAIYYWRRGTNYAEVIAQVPVPERKNAFEETYKYYRPIGTKVPFNDAWLGIKGNKIVLLNGLQWTVLKEIHND